MNCIITDEEKAQKEILDKTTAGNQLWYQVNKRVAQILESPVHDDLYLFSCKKHIRNEKSP